MADEEVVLKIKFARCEKCNADPVTPDGEINGEIVFGTWKGDPAYTVHLYQCPKIGKMAEGAEEL